MSSDLTTPEPSKVGPKRAVLRGIGKFSNADGEAPDSEYSI
ncbi:hypothetical protein ACVWWO_000789 [Bradyrhizobium sp. F1.13.1]